MIRNTLERILGDGARESLLEAGESGAWPDRLWRTLDDSGLVTMFGADLSDIGWREVFEVVVAAGRHCLPLPLPESIGAAWLLAQAGLTQPDGRTGLAGCHPNDDLRVSSTSNGWQLTGRVTRVPWGRYLDYAVLSLMHAGRPYIVAAPLSECAVTTGANLAGEPRDALGFDGQRVTLGRVPVGLEADAARLVGALLRAGQMAGGIAEVLERSLVYARDREQFGRPIGNFQAIQHLLAVLAEESAAAAMAAEQAFVAMDAQRNVDFAIAVAKLRTGEAAGKAVAIGHQVHGAMGFSREYCLHNSTRRLLAWRAEFGAESAWAQRIADVVMPLGPAGLWPFITASQCNGTEQDEHQ